jgi:hypothetical protein
MRKLSLKPMTECQHQIALVKWARLNQLSIVHIPNEGQRSAQGGAILGHMGMSKGFPDLFVAEARGGYFGMFLEVKRNRRYRAWEMKTPTWICQKAWLHTLNQKGYLAQFIFGFEEGIQVLKMYLSWPETTKLKDQADGAKG